MNGKDGGIVSSVLQQKSVAKRNLDHSIHELPLEENIQFMPQISASPLNGAAI